MIMIREPIAMILDFPLWSMGLAPASTTFPCARTWFVITGGRFTGVP